MNEGTMRAIFNITILMTMMLFSSSYADPQMGMENHTPTSGERWVVLDNVMLINKVSHLGRNTGDFGEVVDNYEVNIIYNLRLRTIVRASIEDQPEKPMWNTMRLTIIANAPLYNFGIRPGDEIEIFPYRETHKDLINFGMLHTTGSVVRIDLYKCSQSNILRDPNKRFAGSYTAHLCPIDKIFEN